LLCFTLVMPVRGLFILPTLVIRMYFYKGNPGKFCVLLEVNGHSYLDLVCGFRSIWRIAEYNLQAVVLHESTNSVHNSVLSVLLCSFYNLFNISLKPSYPSLLCTFYISTSVGHSS
jgi:hypothetical protein